MSDRVTGGPGKEAAPSGRPALRLINSDPATRTREQQRPEKVAHLQNRIRKLVVRCGPDSEPVRVVETIIAYYLIRAPRC